VFRFKPSSPQFGYLCSLTNSCKRNSVSASGPSTPAQKGSGRFAARQDDRACVEFLQAGRPKGLTAAAPEFPQHEPAQSRASEPKEKIVMSKPTHLAYVVIEPKQGGYPKAAWREAGAVWPHKNGTKPSVQAGGFLCGG
jgi:hypothetical protein